MADESGMQLVSMRGLAARLGVEAMSLYHHVANKERLLDLMVDRVVGEIRLPLPRRSWKQQMRLRALSACDVLMRHPWATSPMFSRINTGSHMLTYIDRTHGSLLAAGFSHQKADWARHLVDSHIYGHVLQELHFPIKPEAYASSANSFLPDIPADRYPQLRALTQTVINGEYDGRCSFIFGLEIILDGLKRQGKE